MSGPSGGMKQFPGFQQNSQALTQNSLLEKNVIDELVYFFKSTQMHTPQPGEAVVRRAALTQFPAQSLRL